MPRIAIALLLLSTAACVDPAPEGAVWIEADVDLDGFTAAEDCDDTNAGVHPAADEVCGNGLDDDCDGTENHCVLAGAIDLELSARVVGDSAGDHAGWSVAGVGDLDGDGHDDIAVGSYEDGEAGALAGAVWVFYGPIDGKLDPGAADAKLLGEAAGDHAGYSVAGAGDFNNDGFDDLLVGAHGSAAGGAGAGSAYVVFGPISGTHSLADADLLVRGDDPYDYVGMAVTGPGDLTGDGIDDVVVGGYGDDEGGLDAGAAWILPGGTEGDVSVAVGVKLIGTSEEDWSGASLAAAGDLNGDGYADLLVGAVGATRGGPDAGLVYVMHGPLPTSRGLGAAAGRIVGAWAYDNAGSALAAPGDLTGDGVPDVVVGAWGYDGAGPEAGAAWVVTGPISGVRDLRSEPLRIDGVGDGDRAGVAVGGGDLDGDGVADLAIGALHPDDSTRGAVHVLYGPVSAVPLAHSDVRFDGEAAGDLAGFALASAGDTNADGVDDLLIGAHGSDAAGEGAGAAYIVRGTGW